MLLNNKIAPLCLLLMIVPVGVIAQTTTANGGAPGTDSTGASSTAAVANAAPAAAPLQPEYHPSFGDLMTMAVQPRHIKLGLAGKQNNWAYATYELSELRNAFARIARTIPKYQSMDTAEFMTAMTRAPLDSLGRAIAAGDSKQFSIAYAQLTDACNACHQSQKHGAVVIKAPKSDAFPDQEFRTPH